MSTTYIDCEVHVGTPDLSAVLNYMDEGLADRLRRSQFRLPAIGLHPGGGAAPEGFDGRVADSDDAAHVLLVPHQTLPSAGWLDTFLNARYANAFNRWAAETLLPQDPRYRLVAAIAPHEPAEAVAEIERLAGDPRVAGLSMSLLGVNLGQSFYRPILRAAAEHQLPIVIHPSGSEGILEGLPKLGGAGPYRTEVRSALLAQVFNANIASLIFDGVFVELPDLKVVFSDVGFGWILPVLWRLDTEWRNLRLDVPWITEPPSKVLGRNIKLIVSDVDEVPPEFVRHVFARTAANLFVFGSNTPFAHKDREEVSRLIPIDSRDRFFRDNAREAYRI